MALNRFLTSALAAAVICLTAAAGAVATTTDTPVSVNSPVGPFSQNKQNEPAVAVDAHNPQVLAAGANDEIDMEACAAGDPTTCPFTQGVGVSGVYFSFNGGGSWVQPTYTGLTARLCTGPAPCTATTGPIGTLPWYAEAGIVSDGDPAVAFGPRPGADGSFSWANGSRLYYANLTSPVSGAPHSDAFKGAEAIAVSYVDDVASAAAGNKNAWSHPTLISKQSTTTFSDKEQVWADNAESSPFFGSTYVCWASFRSNSHGRALPTPLYVARSRDGGSSWTTQQVSPATDNGINSQPDGCTVRTDSHGNVYVFGIGKRNGQALQLMYRSTDGGAHFTGPTAVAPAVEPGVFDPVLGRPNMDGIAGARVDLADGPSVDIANGAPSGADATDQILMTWADGRNGLNNEQVLMTTSRDGGATWTTAVPVPLPAGDRPFYTAPALSPNGTDAYLTVNAFTTPYRNDTTSPRGLVGEMLHADVAPNGALGPWTILVRGAVGDPRGTSQNGLTAEFLGDYVYTAATRTGAVGVWNDAARAADCPAIDAYRGSLYTATPQSPPDVQGSCPLAFGNSDIRGAAVSDPTP
ncbi:sialidase family protein [Nocardioides ginsengisoli]|uniref:Sialidase family protein n=1 Tax=Nocardioides ginsengisoli TaxID=363868 RepID=A0ABW3VWL9_9ACTN